MTDEPPIGKVFGSKDHTHYFVRVWNTEASGPRPHQQDYRLGQFVLIGEGESRIIGIITSSRIFSVEGFELGFFHRDELETFAPELLEGTAAVLLVTGIGVIDQDGRPLEIGVPSLHPSIHDPVHPLSPDGIIKFHHRDGSFVLGYLSLLKAQVGSEERRALVTALKQLSTLLPQKKPMLDLLIRELEWDARVAGG